MVWKIITSPITTDFVKKHDVKVCFSGNDEYIYEYRFGKFSEHIRGIGDTRRIFFRDFEREALEEINEAILGKFGKNTKVKAKYSDTMKASKTSVKSSKKFTPTTKTITQWLDRNLKVVYNMKQVSPNKWIGVSNFWLKNKKTGKFELDMRETEIMDNAKLKNTIRVANKYNEIDKKRLA